jgi:hypothetical protein
LPLCLARLFTQPDYDIATQALPGDCPKLLSNQSLDAIPTYCCRHHALTDRDAQAGVSSITVYPVDREPVCGLRPTFEYLRESFPATYAIAPGKSLNFFRITRQDVHGHVRDGLR